MSDITTTLTATVLYKTEEALKNLSEVSGLSVGEIIDRLVVNWEAHDAVYPSQLILEDMVMHTQKLDRKHLNLTFAIVLSVIKKSMSDDEPEALKRIVEELDAMLKEADAGDSDSKN